MERRQPDGKAFEKR